MPIVKNHHGIEIHVDGTGTFRATIDGEPLTSTSLADLEKVIDHKTLAKARGQEMSLACLNSEGQEFTISGIHLGNRAMLTKPLQTSRAHIYPDTSSNREILARFKSARAVVTEIEGELRPRRIDTSFGYGRLEAGDYQGEIDKLKGNYQEALERSEPEAGG